MTSTMSRWPAMPAILFKSGFEIGQDKASQTEVALFHMSMDATQEGVCDVSTDTRGV